MTLYVNGEQIDASLIENEMERLRPSYEQTFHDLPEAERQKQLSEWSRENVIERTLFRQEAQRQFPHIGDTLVQQNLDQLLENDGEDGPLHQQLSADADFDKILRQGIANQVRQERLMQELSADVPEPADKSIRRYFQQHLDRYTVPEMVHASHIVKHPNPETSPDEVKAQVYDVYQQLLNGTPFGQLASEHSDCPDQAGDLGFFARGQMVPQFEDAVFALEPGTTSEPFETEFGWHIAHVHEKRPSVPCDIERVRELIAKDLKKQGEEKAMENFLDSLKSQAVIEER